MNIFDNTKAVVQFGFAIILILITSLGSFIYFEFEKLNQNITQIVQISNQKSELAFTMRDAIRLRAISLRNMLAMDDVFDRDEEAQRFNIHASMYAISREKLLGLPKTQAEIEIHKRLDQSIQIASPLNLLASEYFIDEVLDQEKGQKIVDDAFAAQQVALVVLDELVAIQKKFTESTLADVNKSYSSSFELLFVVGFFVMAITFFIMYSIGKFITNKNLALQQATAIKSQFLANMSHEIRTPLTAIIGFTRLLHSNRVDKAKTSETLETVIKNAEHLMHVINDVLDISKIEANRLEVECAKFSLFEFVEDVKNMMESPIQKKGLEFNIAYQYPLPEFISSDEVRLKQILVNLCGNAAKFTEKGSVSIYVEYENSRNQLYFKVRDTGIGLTPDQQIKIFEAFSQAESSTTKKYGGTGLGLSISSQLSQKLGGELKVESQINEGSTFYFSINPGDKSELQFSSSMPEIKQKSVDFMSSIDEVSVTGKILLVDDTIDNQTLISAYLKEMGAEIIIANNGQEAVELTQNNVFDLILMDMQMPVMNGIDAVKLIREQGYSKPIAMLTANALKEEKEKSIEVGCDEFLVKPIDIPELCRVVSKFLDKREVKKNEKNITNISEALEEENSNVVISTLMGRSEKYDRLVTRFVSQLPEFVNNIKEAFKADDFEKLHYHAHRFKGVGGNYGYMDITNICEKIEDFATNGEYKSVDQQIEKLEKLLPMINEGLAVCELKHSTENQLNSG